MIYFLAILLLPVAGLAQGWSQWGQNSRHTGSVNVVGQSADRILSTLIIDPWAPRKVDDGGGDLLAHYPSPVVDGQDVFLMLEGGRYAACADGADPCGPDAWNLLQWSVQRHSWSDQGTLDPQWAFVTDWTPVPGVGWEPVFHPVVSGGIVYAPGAGGTVWKINRADGSPVQRVNPFDTIDPNTYVSGPLTADDQGNLYYSVIQLSPAQPLAVDVVNSWLVKIAPDGTTLKATYTSLTPDAPGGTSQCVGTFLNSQRPWPPSPTAVPGTSACGTQRPGVNISPAVGKDGTIYTLSRAHLNSRYSYLVAVNPDLTLKWTSSLRGRLNDGCGFTIPISNSGGCRQGTRLGVDYQTNDLPAGRVVDSASSTPVIAPDGSILFGADTSYNSQRGHLMHYDSTGAFLNSFDFGWDTTPAIWEHDGAYSIILKDNHYGGGPYFISQLSPEMKVEWQFQSTNTQSCVRNDDGTIGCTDATDTNPNGFEWCVNAAAVDSNGTVYVNSEDGNLYVIGQGGVLQQRLFLDWALGAAYTPLALGPDGKIYTQNAGKVFVVGASASTAPVGRSSGPRSASGRPEAGPKARGEARLFNFLSGTRVRFVPLPESTDWAGQRPAAVQRTAPLVESTRLSIGARQ